MFYYIISEAIHGVDLAVLLAITDHVHAVLLRQADHAVGAVQFRRIKVHASHEMSPTIVSHVRMDVARQRMVAPTIDIVRTNVMAAPVVPHHRQNGVTMTPYHRHQDVTYQQNVIDEAIQHHHDLARAEISRHQLWQ